jgi:hypothetical protein
LPQLPIAKRHPSPMMRRTLPAIALLACALSPAQAHEQAIHVYFQPLQDGEVALLNKAILEALAQPPLQLAEKPSAGAVVVAVQGKVEVTRKKVSGTYYDFTVAFSRDGSSLGQSAQSCSDKKLSDCTDQLVQDVKSVAGAR